MDHVTPTGMPGRAGRLAVFTTIITITGLIGPGIGTAQAGQIGSANPAAPIEAAVLDQVADGGETTFWVKLDRQADLSTAASIADWETRGAEVYETLTTTADTSQAGLRALLADRGVDYRPFWIVNAIQVTGDEALVDELAARPEVAEIIASRTFAIPETLPATDNPPTINAVEWGVDRIGAPDVWDTFDARGEGIVVGIIDTGGSFNHPALVDKYRGNLGGGQFDHNYNWHDPSNVCGTPSLQPCDNHGHATHVTGTVLGDDGGTNQIGVAPEAKWIAAKGCETNNCSDEALLSSGQFMIAPTDLNGENPDTDLRPHIVNNSWGGDPDTNPWYEGIVDGWVAAGIFPQFANGNTLTGVAPCGSSSNPGNLPAAYAAGAFDINNNIANFSNRGPSAWGSDVIKPNVSAPGVSVRSSLPGGYGLASGTSMASPHVAGAVALLWSAAPELNGEIDATRELIDDTAIDMENLTCGGTAENNNVWGQGRLDIFAAVSAAVGAPGDPAIEVDPDSLSAEQAEGEVTDQPLTISNVGDGTLDWTVFTDEPQQLPTGSTPVTEAGGVTEAAAPGAGLATQRRLLGGTFGTPQAVTPETPAPQQDEVTITHSASQAIVPLNSVACSSDGGFSTTENGYLRHFTLEDFDITGAFGVTEVSFAIENLTAPSADVTVNLFTMIDPAGPFVYANFEEIGSATASLTSQQATIVAVPVTGTAPAGSTLVVEVDVPDLTGIGGFFIGSNPDGQTAPSYLRSASCGLAEPTDTAAIGFPGMQIVMNVTGTTDVTEPVCGSPADIPWLSVSPESGSTAAGDSSEVAVSFDSTGLALGEYEAVLCVESNDPATPLVQVPVSLSVVEGGGGEPVVCDETITGVHSGPLTVSEGVTCLAAGAQVLGEVNVSQGAGLIATAAVIQGPVSAIGATVVELVFTQVTGPVLVAGATGEVSLFASQVTGSVSLLNGVTDAASTVSGNTVIGSLSCFGNASAPTDHGLPNTATGGKLGQCAEL